MFGSRFRRITEVRLQQLEKRLTKVECQVSSLEAHNSVYVGPPKLWESEIPCESPSTDLRHIVDSLLKYLKLELHFEKPQSGFVDLRKLDEKSDV